MSEYKLSENNWTKVAVFAGGDRGHYRTDFDCFVGVDRGSLWILEEDLPLALAVGDFDSVTAEERQVIQKRAQHFVQAQPEKDDTDLELALLTIFEQNAEHVFESPVALLPLQNQNPQLLGREEVFPPRPRASPDPHRQSNQNLSCSVLGLRLQKRQP